MATLMDRVRAYLRSPKGRQNIDKAKRMAQDPGTQQKLRRFLDRLRSRRH
ncbi:hypothetical protein [Nonomuraea basaltis]|nr:hypothetical protein [Nonomuraea basaltis]